jgi:monovalent cation:H+ antiporter-2, CPA2 family
VEPELAPLATAYVLITVVSGPMLARLPDYARFKTRVRRRMAMRRTAGPLATSDGHERRRAAQSY